MDDIVNCLGNRQNEDHVFLAGTGSAICYILRYFSCVIVVLFVSMDFRWRKTKLLRNNERWRGKGDCSGEFLSMSISCCVNFRYFEAYSAAKQSFLSSSVSFFFRKIVCPVHARVLVQQNGLVAQIVAVLVRPQESHVVTTARADRRRNHVEITWDYFDLCTSFRNGSHKPNTNRTSIFCSLSLAVLGSFLHVSLFCMR